MGIFGRDNKEDTSGGSGDHRTASNKKKKNIIQKIAENSPTLKVIKAIGEGVKKGIETAKKRKVNTSLLGSPDYQGDVEGRRSRVKTNQGGDGENNATMVATTPTTAKTSELQKAAVKAAPVGPTVADIGNVEETEEQRLLRIKRKGRRATKLAAEDDELYLSKKALLG